MSQFARLLRSRLSGLLLPAMAGLLCMGLVVARAVVGYAAWLVATDLHVHFSNPADRTVIEAMGQVSVTVELSAASSITVTVNITSSDGTATAGSDYVPISSTLTFEPGTTEIVVPISITDDSVYEA